jgi:small subunit ribosomal protein S21
MGWTARSVDVILAVSTKRACAHRVRTRVEYFREFHLVKLTLRDRESAQEAVRRFRKLVERSGIKKEIRIREFYEKPSETKRRARLRAQRRSRRDRTMTR